MTLILVIESATRQATIALGQDESVVFTHDGEPGGNRDLAGMVQTGLAAIEATTADIDLIAVNQGPGGLSSVRCGAAFANALAFSLKRPLLPYNGFELLGFHAQQSTERPVLCTSKAADGKAFVGLYHQGKLSHLRFGPLAMVLQEVLPTEASLAVAGSMRKHVLQALPQHHIEDTGLTTAPAATAIRMIHPVRERWDHTTHYVEPINDQSTLFSQPVP